MIEHPYPSEVHLLVEALDYERKRNQESLEEIDQLHSELANAEATVYDLLDQIDQMERE